MEKLVTVGDKTIKMRASALIPRLYRFKFGRDMISDMAALQKAFERVSNLPGNATQEEKNAAQLSVFDLTVFENAAYIMAKHADASQPNTPDEWLEQFDMFSIYQVLPQMMELWNVNHLTTSVPKKK